MYTDNESRKKLYGLIEDARFAMITTVNEDGTLYSCPMTLQECDDNGHLWFFLEKECETARNLQANMNLNLGFANPGDDEYVAISGLGQLIDNRARIAELWKEPLRAWFPEGQDDPKIALLRVDPQSGQFWDSPSSTLEMVVGYVKSLLGSKEGRTGIDSNRKVMM